MNYDRLELPMGQLVTAQEILTGIALLEVGALTDLAAGQVFKICESTKRYDVKKAPYGASLSSLILTGGIVIG